ILVGSSSLEDSQVVHGALLVPVPGAVPLDLLSQTVGYIRGSRDVAPGVGELRGALRRFLSIVHPRQVPEPCLLDQMPDFGWRSQEREFRAAGPIHGVERRPARSLHDLL